MWSEELLETLPAARISGSCDTVLSQGPASYMSPGFLPYTAGVVWDDVRVINVDFLGWSDVSLEWRYLDSVLFLATPWILGVKLNIKAC